VPLQVQSRRAVMLVVALASVLVSGCAVGTTGSPDAVSVDAARVFGRVTTNVGGATSYWVEYGPTRAYGSETAHESQDLEANASTLVSVTIAGLARNTRYHYRVCAKDSEGGVCGQDRAVTTQNVICGQTVTADVTLTGDLDCDFDPLGPTAGPGGLKVDAAGIEIDLGGHGIGGPIFQGGAAELYGIDNTGGFDDVTIRNGGVGGWGVGIALTDASRNAIRNVAAQGSPTGASITGGADNTIRRGSMAGRGLGLVIDHSPGTTAVGPRLRGAFQAGLAINSDLVSVSEADIGVLSGASRPVEIAGSGNRLAYSRIGVETATGGYAGVAVLSGSGNRVIGNEVTGSLGSPEFGFSGDGIEVDSSTSGTVLRSNAVHHNSGDGIDVNASSARLGDNNAFSNGDLGIEAVAGVTDLGGNRASGNGNPLQCVNVFCQ
jgi:parallel beta-helix repeat protein